MKSVKEISQELAKKASTQLAVRLIGLFEGGAVDPQEQQQPKEKQSQQQEKVATITSQDVNKIDWRVVLEELNKYAAEIIDNATKTVK